MGSASDDTVKARSVTEHSPGATSLGSGYIGAAWASVAIDARRQGLLASSLSAPDAETHPQVPLLLKAPSTVPSGFELSITAAPVPLQSVAVTCTSSEPSIAFTSDSATVFQGETWAASRTIRIVPIGPGEVVITCVADNRGEVGEPLYTGYTGESLEVRVVLCDPGLSLSSSSLRIPTTGNGTVSLNLTASPLLGSTVGVTCVSANDSIVEVHPSPADGGHRFEFTNADALAPARPVRLFAGGNAGAAEVTCTATTVDDTGFSGEESATVSVTSASPGVSFELPALRGTTEGTIEVRYRLRAAPVEFTRVTVQCSSSNATTFTVTSGAQEFTDADFDLFQVIEIEGANAGSAEIICAVTSGAVGGYLGHESATVPITIDADHCSVTLEADHGGLLRTGKVDGLEPGQVKVEVQFGVPRAVIDDEETWVSKCNRQGLTKGEPNHLACLYDKKGKEGYQQLLNDGMLGAMRGCTIFTAAQERGDDHVHLCVMNIADKTFISTAYARWDCDIRVIVAQHTMMPPLEIRSTETRLHGPLDRISIGDSEPDASERSWSNARYHFCDQRLPLSSLEV